MKPVQIVFDEPLLREVDRQARSRQLSRSQFVRQTIEESLERLKHLEYVEQERAAYRRLPTTKEEKATLRALSRGANGAVHPGEDW